MNFFDDLHLLNFFVAEYSFNPCKPFSEGAKCIQAAVCQGEWLLL